MTLSELTTGRVAVVEGVNVDRHGGDLVNRLEALGLITNKPICVLRRAWLGGPLHVRVGLTTEIAIRPKEAAMVMVRPLDGIADQ